MMDNMLGPSPMHIKYVYWTIRRPDSVRQNSATTDQYQGTYDAIYNVIALCMSDKHMSSSRLIPAEAKTCAEICST